MKRVPDGAAWAPTQLILGCGRMLGGTEMRASARLVEAALAIGIRHFDTAPSYGDGGGEALLGELLRGVPDATVTTKVGREHVPVKPSTLRMLYRRAARPLLARMPGLKRRLVRPPSTVEAPPVARAPLTVEMLERSLERSERALGRRADVLLVHEPRLFTLGDDARGWFAAQVAAGRIGAYGLGAGAGLAAEPAFGDVRQAHVTLLADDRPARLRIGHGLLRTEDGRPADERVGAWLDANPTAALIVSASAPAQIRQLVR